MRKQWKGAAAVFAALAFTVLILSGCSSSASTPASTTGSASTAPAAKGPIVVGSKIDGEGALLGQIILQTLKANGFTVVDKTRTGATKVVRQALIDGQIDIYPEYTANGPLVFHSDIKTDPSVLQSATATYDAAKSEDASIGIVWLAAAPANNTWAVAIPKALSDSKNIKSLVDLAAYINKGGTFKIVGSQEFFTSAPAFPAFEKAYGFKLKPSQEVALATGDTAVTEKAAALGSQGANAAMAYGTDGTISALNLVVLDDPKGAQPIYQPAPIVRKAIADKYPELGSILDPVFAKLDFTTLQTLNKSVGVDGTAPKDVAATWLKSVGVVK
jgi:osmoprotectant transport system substrate-binding protein